MRPPARITRSTRQMSETQDPLSPARRATNSKIAPKPAARGAQRPNGLYVEKKPRHRMTDLQLEWLEALYQQATHPTREQKQALGEEVGMDTRTVTVWFQNRRQLQKKQSMILGSAPQAMCRHPLRTVSQASSQATSRQPSVSSVSQLSAPHTPLFRSSSCQQSRHLELWEHLPSSPATNFTVSAATSALPSPLAKKFPSIFGAECDASQENKENKKRKPILEWACARVAKRQRMQAVEEDDEGTEDDSDLDTTLVDIKNVPQNAKSGKVGFSDVALGKKVAALVPKAVSIPSEYTQSFDADVVLGASLLLAFQQACKKKAQTVS